MAFPVAAVAGGAFAEYEAEQHGLLDPSTPAGWATILGITGFVALVVLFWREGGFVGAVGRALEFVLVVAAAEMGIHYLARSESLKRPDSPFWGGVGLNL